MATNYALEDAKDTSNEWDKEIAWKSLDQLAKNAMVLAGVAAIFLTMFFWKRRYNPKSQIINLPN